MQIKMTKNEMRQKKICSIIDVFIICNIGVSVVVDDDGELIAIDHRLTSSSLSQQWQ